MDGGGREVWEKVCVVRVGWVGSGGWSGVERRGCYCSGGCHSCPFCLLLVACCLGFADPALGPCLLLLLWLLWGLLLLLLLLLLPLPLLLLQALLLLLLWLLLLLLPPPA